ncbi:TIGR01457 family HAD-type hydrolase [Paenibacillus sp. KN14-4R]|uniref:TIGR01457 family HAD-type hydrolase n=1 Tax=Paenibacillus sp. KN14-4R TaxID=3445773 RepID=UPI003F9F0482
MQAFIIDLDGTLYKGNEPIPGADQFIAKLSEQGHPFQLVTNNSSKTPEAVSSHLAKFGIRVEPEQIFTSAQATVQYLQEEQLGKRVYVIGEEGIRTALQESYYEIVEESPDVVVQGIDRSFNYAKLAAATAHIQSGARFVLTNPDHLLPADGKLWPGAGTIAASIEKATGRQPVVIGKPSPIIMRYAMSRLGAAANHTWVIGDNCITDIAGGAAVGCRTALVLTGIATESNWREQAERAGVQPDLVCASLEEVYEQVTTQR